MKTISKILIFVSMSLALSGCDDFLTKEPETNLSPNTFLSLIHISEPTRPY